MRRIFTFLIVTISVLLPWSVWASHFPDVPSTHPNYEAIETLAENDFIEGYNDGTFQPSRLVTRAELTAMIIRALQVDSEVGRYKNCFDDVRKQWFARYVCFGKSTRWLSGYPGTQLFRPGSNVIIVESLRMIIDAFDVQRIAATEFLKRKWDVPYGYKNLGRAVVLPPQWYEDYLVTARELKFLDITPYHVAKMMNRAEIAEIIYRVLKYTDFDFAGSRTEGVAPGGTIGSIQRGIMGSTQGGTEGSTEDGEDVDAPRCTLPIQKPIRLATFTPAPFCAFDLSNTHSKQLWIGQAYLSSVWGEPFYARLEKPSWAMALAYASELFHINPNYLLAVAVKESRLNCLVNSDGCFQIGTPGFSEVKAQFPLYIDFSAEHTLVQPFEIGVVLAALYFRFAEALYERWYQWINFYTFASDKEARELVMSRAFNHGLWDLGIKSALKNNRTMCQRTNDLLDTCFSDHAIAFDHAQSVKDYCQALGHTNNLYDASLTRNDIQDFIRNTLIPTYAASARVNWTSVQNRSNNIFDCLADSHDTISFRYDFKTFLQELFKVLPLPQRPQNNTYTSP